MGVFDWLFGRAQPRRRDRKEVVIESPRGKRYRVAPGSKAMASLQRRGWRVVNPSMTTAERAALPDSAFAAPSIRALPIHDAAHVRAALGRFTQTVFPGRAEAVAAARRIVKAAKLHGVPVSGKSAVARMAGAYVERVPDRRRKLDVEYPD